MSRPGLEPGDDLWPDVFACLPAGENREMLEPGADLARMLNDTDVSSRHRIDEQALGVRLRWRDSRPSAWALEARRVPEMPGRPLGPGRDGPGLLALRLRHGAHLFARQSQPNAIGQPLEVVGRDRYHAIANPE